MPTAHSNADDGQAITWEAARRLVQDVEVAFGAADLARIAQGPPRTRWRGSLIFRRYVGGRDHAFSTRASPAPKDRVAKDAACAGRRHARQYLGCKWENARTGKPMLGRGTEIWRVRDGRIALWDATFNVWEKRSARDAGGVGPEPLAAAMPPLLSR